MFAISDCKHLQVTTTVEEYDINKIKKGQKVIMLTDATDEDEIEGEVTFAALTAGSSSLNSSGSGNTSQTQSGGSSSGSSSGTSSGYSVKICIKKADERLRIGMTAKCSIVLEEVTDVFAVPYDAIHENTNGENVIYAMDTFGKKEVVVTKGMESDYYVEISGDDLQEGMQVMIPSDATSESKEKGDASTEKDGMPGMNGGMRSGRDNSFSGDKMPGGPGGGMPGGN